MARCKGSGREYKPCLSSWEFDNDSYILEHGMNGTYRKYHDLCADCAIAECMAKTDSQKLELP